jgi:hypothetical protein
MSVILTLGTTFQNPTFPAKWEITGKYITPEQICVILYVFKINNAPILHIIVALVS